MKIRLKKMVGSFLLFGLVVGVASLNSANVFGEGWISGGAPSGNVSGGGGGGGDCSGGVGYYDLACTGYSWIYYKYIGGATGKGKSIYFRRDGFLDDLGYDGDTNNIINGQCTAHGGSGGFWHLGYNAKGLEYGSGINVMIDVNGGVKGLSSWDHVYSVGEGKWGHALTFDYGTIPDYYKKNGGEKTYSNASLGHVIYKKINGEYVPMYEAVKFGDSTGGVLGDFKVAYENVNNKEYTKSTLPNNVYAFCYWAGLDHRGRVRILGSSSTSDNYDNYSGWKETTDWVKTEKTIEHTVEDCPESGCDVQFRHYLKNTKGNGTTQYKIVRSLNDTDTETFTGKKNLAKGDNDWVMSNVVTMKPGQTVCETLYWSEDENTAPGGTPYAKACVTAKKSQPQGNTTTYEAKLNMTVENERTKKSGSTVYAKPGESVVYHVEYDSAPQTTVNFLPNRMRVNGGDAIIDSEAKNLNNLFNDNNGDMPDWNNRFMVFGDLFGSDGFSDGNDVGEASVGLYNIDMDNTVEGNRYEAWAEINPSSDLETWTTPSKVEITWDGNNDTTANVFTDRLRTDNTTVVVPYNFENKVEIEGYRDGDVVYAGETINDFGYRLIVGDKPNSLVDDTYATKVPGARWKFIMEYSNGDSEELDGGNGDLKSGDNIKTSPIKISDVPAGTEVCVTAQLFPRFSGNDDNIDKNNFSGISDKRVCLTVAKKPSFQVWGGNLYSGSDIDAKSATKMTIADGYSGDLPRTFGSWAELALVKGAGNDDMASGAGFGYTVDGWNGRIRDESYDTLTYGGSGGSDKKLELSYVEELLGDNYEKQPYDGSTLSGIVPSGNGEEARKFLYTSEGNISIMRNIEVDRNGSTEPYRSFEKTPSVVIYTTGDIYISCSVERIDAILIAGGTINTCCQQSGDGDPYDDDDIRKRDVGAKQLVVNGALWAQRINFFRPVGARTGKGSGEPAEIINYDSSFMIPGTGSVDAGRDETTLGNFVVEAVSELAPRY